ncbi:esterase [Hylemonella gracilis str. Niagara R]|uniref:Esterase n=1 Tax=Hylemonella gracilis str. Niagara R TaxID=1458275 RepID=A0A016XIP8_9BURK|nr:alpha/beta hydrolase-fold protein [Hylemonella gracilis]EYC51721.1 esterase [Hylemonella gracilis str. Niagara R]
MLDPDLLGPSHGMLLGRLNFTLPGSPTQPPLPAGRHNLQFPEGREAVLVVPEGLDITTPVPLLVLCHGAGGEADKVLPYFVRWARARRFLLLTPQSLFPTWDIVIGGHGPDLERLDTALRQVAACFRLDPARIALAGFSDGGSYALSVGLSNGDLFSHVIALSAGFMNAFTRHGTPKVFLAHGRSDTQLPYDTSARTHALKLLEEGVDLTLLPFDGEHRIEPAVVAQAVAFFMGEEGAQAPAAQRVVPDP